MLAQVLMIAFFVACHHREHIMHTATHIPLKESTAALRINVEVLLVTFNYQFILAVPIEIGKGVALPVGHAGLCLVSGIFSFDEVMINS